MTTEKKNEPFKKCACGRVYATREDWEKLPDSKTFFGEDGAHCDMRRCECGSHVAAALVPAMDTNELRRAVRVVNMMREDFNDGFTAFELLRLVKLCWLSGWDVLPDEWTQNQVANALATGEIPRFGETRDGLHALGVDDCRCRACRSARQTATEAADE